MRRTVMTIAGGLLMLLPGMAQGQQPVKSFDQLNVRLKVGDKVLVTDTQGRQYQGKIDDLSSTVLVVDRTHRLSAADVQLVEDRPPDTLKNGALIGMGTAVALVGGSMAAACSGEPDCAPSAGWMTFAIGVYAGIGAAIGTGIDALIPGRTRVVYRAPGPDTAARLRLVPSVRPGAKGIALSVSF
jgi:hypothetical protein